MPQKFYQEEPADPQEGKEPEPIPAPPELQHNAGPHHVRFRFGRRMNIVRNLFALIGVGTVLVEAARYVFIPLLVWLQTLMGA